MGRNIYRTDEEALVTKVALHDRTLKPSFTSDAQPVPDTSSEQEPEDETMPTATVAKEVPREGAKRRRPRTEPEAGDYEALFIRDTPLTTRNGKAVYIRKEFHDNIMRIVQNIGFNDVSLFSYIDNVLEYHFRTFQNDINALYHKRKPEDIINY